MINGRESARRPIRKNYYRHSLNNPIFGKRCKFKEQHQRQSIKIKIILAISIILLGVIFWFLFFSNFFKIKNINITGQGRITADMIESAARNQADKGWWFVRQDNLWLFKGSKLETDLYETYKLAEVKINKKIPGEINITIKERQYAFIWNLNDVYYYTDRDGYIIKEVASLVQQEPSAFSSEIIILDSLSASTTNTSGSSTNQLSSAGTSTSQVKFDPIPTEIKQDSIIYPIVVFNGDKKAESGHKIQDLIRLDDYILTSLQRLDERFAALQDADIILSNFIIKDQFTVEVKVKSGLSLYFNPKEDLDKQFNNLLIIKANKKYDFNKIQPGNYINLKYGDKIFCYPESK